MCQTGSFTEILPRNFVPSWLHRRDSDTLPRHHISEHMPPQTATSASKAQPSFRVFSTFLAWHTISSSLSPSPFYLPPPAFPEVLATQPPGSEFTDFSLDRESTGTSSVFKKHSFYGAGASRDRILCFSFLLFFFFLFTYTRTRPNEKERVLYDFITDKRKLLTHARG